jgi:hypothetical protein
MSNKPNIAKRHARTVNRRIEDDGATWPPDLYKIARNCAHALDMVPRQERHLRRKVFLSFVQQSVATFTAALAEFESRQ